MVQVKFDFAIVGAGIVGLSVGMALSQQYKNASILILDKEAEISLHQTGRNSGVIHSGIYYKPGSLKAKLAKTGNKQMVEFCKTYGVKHEVCGKVIVATEEKELSLLENLYKRGVENGLRVERITADEVKEIEPHVNGIAGIRVPSTGIVDYREVAASFARIIEKGNGIIALNTEVQSIDEEDEAVTLHTNKGDFQTRFLINCAGLLSDRVAEMSHVKTDLRIVPFRGEYYELKKDRRHLVKNMIYPVPNPDFPFLGVHFTRMNDGRVLIGPNAVLSFKREGYQKTSFLWKDFMETIAYPGFQKLAMENASEGLREMYRSFSKKQFIKDVQKFIPEIKREDLVPAKAGVRAQALDSDGALLDDFVIIQNKQMIHVCNAPSPAATASIEIGREIVKYLTKSISIFGQ